MKNKSLKRALIMSVISILVCSAMLVGATFAWFSDTVSTGVNTIVAGNLKVDIQDIDGNSLVGTSLFNFDLDDDGEDDVLWEPGMMFVSDSFVIANLGTVALQYSITTVMEDLITTADGHGLSEVINYKVAKASEVEVADTAAARAEYWASLEDGDKTGPLGVTEDDSTSDELVVVLYWAPTANDNLYNVEVGADQLKTEFSISVQATQASSESDGFGPGYDDGAYYADVIVSNSDELKTALESATSGTIIGIDANLELTDDITIPSGVTLVGSGADSTTIEVGANGYTITSDNVTLKDLKIDGSAVTNTSYNAAIKVNAGSATLENVVVEGGAQHTWGASILVISKAESITVKGCTISGGFRGILAESTSANVIVEQCDIDATYPINFDGAKGYLTVKDSQLRGWTSYGNACAGAEFENVTFTTSTSGYNNVRAYVNTTFTNCTFGEKFWFDTAGSNNIVVNFIGCTLSDESALTATNFEEKLLWYGNGITVNTNVFVDSELVSIG